MIRKGILKKGEGRSKKDKQQHGAIFGNRDDEQADLTKDGLQLESVYKDDSRRKSSTDGHLLTDDECYEEESWGDASRSKLICLCALLAIPNIGTVYSRIRARNRFTNMVYFPSYYAKRACVETNSAAA